MNSLGVVNGPLINQLISSEVDLGETKALGLKITFMTFWFSYSEEPLHRYAENGSEVLAYVNLSPDFIKNNAIPQEFSPFTSIQTHNVWGYEYSSNHNWELWSSCLPRQSITRLQIRVPLWLYVKITITPSVFDCLDDSVTNFGMLSNLQSAKYLCMTRLAEIQTVF